MTINEYIAQLLEIKRKQGDIEVYFDCPKCSCAFAPNKVVIIAVHITDEK